MKQVLSGAVFILMFTILVQSFAQSQEVPAEAIKTFDAFLQTWLVDQNIDHALSYFDKSNDFSNQIKSAFEIPNKKNLDLDLWLRKTLVMWLVSDHGSIDVIGHGDPLKKGYQFLPTVPENLTKRIHPTKIDEAIGLKVMKMDPKNTAIMIEIGLRHAPHDALLFLMKKVNTEWKITFYIWMAG